jgi:group I intron endonuclease
MSNNKEEHNLNAPKEIILRFGIYLIRNIINNKKYIGSTGSTVGFYRRWAIHKSELRGGYHRNKHLQYSWNKYGEQNFEFSILEECSENMLVIREQAWIDYYDSMNPLKDYNHKEAANNGKLSLETKQKISDSQKGINTWSKGRKHSQKQNQEQSHRMKGNTINLGRKWDDNYKQKMSDSCSGKIKTEITKQKMRDAWKLRKLKKQQSSVINAAQMDIPFLKTG